jgi:acyl-coenzyme A synthetase/AMP-(fatty) acid ligase
MGETRPDIGGNLFYARKNQLATGLLNLDLKKGNKILVIMPRNIEAYVTYIACLKAGFVVIPCSEMLRPKDLSYRIDHGEAKAVITDSAFVDQIDSIIDPIPTLKYKIVNGKKICGWIHFDNLMDGQPTVSVRDGYGQTENTLIVGTLDGMEVRPGSMGKPTPGNKIEIINEDGVPVGVGEIGDIAVHRNTPALFKKYYKNPEKTAMSFRGDYYLTGDKAKKDEDGYFWFEGRGDDIIISAGYTIGPFEVEDALVKHPLVKECAVVASPDEVRGQIVKAYVVLKNRDDTNYSTIIKTLQNHVKQLTAPYKYPRKIEFVEELPKTTSGKIRRIELRQRE